MNYRPIASAVLAAATLGATSASAQTFGTVDNRDVHFNGPYVSGTFGIAASADKRSDALTFDTNRDGTYGDQVTTAAGANAFSPGFCGGAARGTTPETGCRSDRDRIAYAGRIGYDRRMGNFVVGGLIEGSGNNATDFTSGFSTTPASYTIARDIKYAASARARAGFTPGGGALFYATGGGSYARIDHVFTTTNGANSFTEARDKKMVWGYQAGGGAEIMVTDHVSIGLEYLYNDYKDNKYVVAVGQGTAPATNPFLLTSGGTNIKNSENDLKFHTMSATVSFRF